MSHNDDLLLVTACRDKLVEYQTTTWKWEPIASAALSLIEDTLNRHRALEWGQFRDLCCQREGYHVRFPCDDYRDHLTALHTIATALGIDPE